MEFFQVNAHNNAFLHGSIDSLNTVVELKYDPEAEEDARWVSSHFPFRMTKSSKYVNGIASLCLF